MKTSTLALAIQTTLEALNDGALPTSKVLFDHVWIGTPKKIPMGDRRVAIIDVLSEPEFHYTTCPANTPFDVTTRINIMVKGHVENATLDVMDMVDVIKKAIYSDDTFGSTCSFTIITNVEYGNVAGDGKNVVEGAYIDIMSRLL